MNNKVIEFSRGKPKRRKYNMALTEKRKKQIEEQVQEVIRTCKFTKLPTVDISSLIEKDGFKIKTELMPIHTTGILFVDESDEDNPIREITVNEIFTNPNEEEDIIYKKSRFISAHEYGHYILHGKTGILSQPIYIHRDSDTREEEIELEADYFARAILMPALPFKECYNIAKRITGNDIILMLDILSKAFGVTQKKVSVRIKDMQELGLITEGTKEEGLNCNE